MMMCNLRRGVLQFCATADQARTLASLGRLGSLSERARILDIGSVLWMPLAVAV